MVTELIGAADGGAPTEEDTMHQVTMRATALQYTRQHQAQAAAERARLLDQGRRPRLRARLPLVSRGAVTRWGQARSSSAAAAKI
jgi:hypothetical protein